MHAPDETLPEDRTWWQAAGYRFNPYTAGAVFLALGVVSLVGHYLLSGQTRTVYPKALFAGGFGSALGLLLVLYPPAAKVMDEGNDGPVLPAVAAWVGAVAAGLLVVEVYIRALYGLTMFAF